MQARTDEVAGKRLHFAPGAASLQEARNREDREPGAPAVIHTPNRRAVSGGGERPEFTGARS